MVTTSLLLGNERDNHHPVELQATHLLRHMVAVGSSGSGKTVLCKVVVEECVRQGIPVICVDPQGDLCSLALTADDPQPLIDKGVDPVLAQQFATAAEVVVFTPAARKGVALSADPIQGDVAALSQEEQIYAIGSMATVLAGLLDYKLDSSEGRGVVVLFESMLTDTLRADIFPEDLHDFTEYCRALDGAQEERYTLLVKASTLASVRRQLAQLDVGARRLLFHQGVGLDIDLLLGRGAASLPQAGKTRVAVIYLNTLNSQADKAFFVAVLADRLYRWMLKNPSQSPQALFYIDEVAPFIPPVREPASKQGLSLLFKQARKYGVCCLMATQNPGDVDYKALAQFGTWAIGRLTTLQDIKKIESALKSLDPDNADQIRESLPGLTAGQFFLFSPDAFKHAKALQARWLYSKHETLSETQIAALCDERWGHFSALERVAESDNAANSEITRVPQSVAAAPLLMDEPMTSSQNRLFASQLARSCSMSASEFSALTGMSEVKARTTLKTLMAAGLAASYKESRTLRYWAIESRLRPDLGLCRPVTVVTPLIARQQVEAIAHASKAQKRFGFIGNDETVADITLAYHVCLRLSFRETAAKGLLGRLLRDKATVNHQRRLNWREKIGRVVWQSMTSGLYEERADNLYLHPQTLHIVTFSADSGISLEERPQAQASDIEDFDSLVMEERLPADLQFDEHHWQGRRQDADIKKLFVTAYDVSPQTIEPCFFPIWRIHFNRDASHETRIVTIDALTGQALRWL
ncbi:MAG: DUF853 family protein [Gammaproteobacteria bacterium]|nr:DUF853 family protein [Gammaproteobacteria bacterium]